MLDCLYEDGEILVLDKPAGLPSQPGEAVRISLVEVVERDFGIRPFLVHRLDRETSGCIIVAKSARAAAKWSALIESRELRKIYEAIAAGSPDGDKGIIEERLRTRSGERDARTDWRVLARFGATFAVARGSTVGPEGPGVDSGAPGGAFCLLELELGTGRMHQLRLHLAAKGMPILGDDRHGDFALNKALRRKTGLKRMLLHARSLELPGGRMLRSPLPEHFRDFLRRFADAPELDCDAPCDAPCGAPCDRPGGGA
jgi:23S rRNA pseudouridine955/2504/2580 synthase